MKLLDRLALIQKELKCPKSQFNAFAKYNYRNCEDIMTAVKPLLTDCVLTITDDVVFIGNRFYIKATATLRNAEQTIEVSAYAREEEVKKGMDASQISGASSSYARKYCLNGLFLIDDTKDADSTNQHGKDEPVATSQETKPKEKDVPEPKEETDKDIIGFLGTDENGQKLVLKTLCVTKGYEAKKPIDGMNASDRLKFVRFLLKMEDKKGE